MTVWVCVSSELDSMIVWPRVGTNLINQILTIQRYHILNFHCFYIQFLELQMERKNKVTSADDEHQPVVNSTIK